MRQIAMNVSDKKIYTKKEDGTIVAVANFNDPDATVDLSDVLAMSIALG